jgi:flagellar basal-body rod protein FlgG
MNDSLYIAATGMQAQQLNVDTIANNLVNINTAGFKAGRVNFQELVYRGMGPATASAGALGLERGSGVAVAMLAKVFSQGELKQTGNALDVGIRGSGFLEVTLADGGTAFTRAGTLQVNRDGFLASDGNVLKPAINVGMDAGKVVIEADGRVMVGDAKGSLNEVGRLELALFNDPSALAAAGQNLYKATEQSGAALYSVPGEGEFGTLAQGYVESSNVKMTDEMVNLMVAQRAYEMSVKVIQASDEMLAMSNNLRR